VRLWPFISLAPIAIALMLSLSTRTTLTATPAKPIHGVTLSTGVTPNGWKIPDPKTADYGHWGP